MTTRLVFLTVVCVGSLAFGQANTPRYRTGTKLAPVATPAPETDAPKTPAPATPAPGTPAPGKTFYVTPVPDTGTRGMPAFFWLTPYPLLPVPITPVPLSYRITVPPGTPPGEYDILVPPGTPTNNGLPALPSRAPAPQPFFTPPGERPLVPTMPSPIVPATPGPEYGQPSVGSSFSIPNPAGTIAKLSHGTYTYVPLYPSTPAPAKPAPKTPGYVDPFWGQTTVPPPPPPTGATPVPVPATPAPKAAANNPGGTIAKPASEPMGFTMHFHMGGNFDASFEMNVTQGKAKQKESPAKKRKMQQDCRPATPTITPSGYPTPTR